MIRLIILSLLTCSIIGFAEENSDFSKMKITDGGNLHDLPKVEDNNENVVVSYRNIEACLKDTPGDCMARRVAERRRALSWRPKWRYARTNGVWLPHMACSPDHSVLAIIENTGSGNGPRGSRIILINTYNWKTLRIINFPSEKLVNFCFIPNADRIICYMEAQRILEQANNKLYVVDLTSGDKSEAITPPGGGPGCMFAIRRFFFIKPDYSNKVFRYDIGNILNLSGKFNFIKGRICYDIAPDNRTVVMAGNEKIKLYDALNDISNDSLRLPSGYNVASAAFIDHPQKIAVSASGRDTLLFDGKFTKEIPGNGEGMLFYNPDEQLLFIKMIKRSMLVPYRMPDLEEIKNFSPALMRPKSGGRIIFMDWLPNKRLVMVSSHGDLIKFELRTKKKNKHKTQYRWYKTIITSALE